MFWPGIHMKTFHTISGYLFLGAVTLTGLAFGLHREQKQSYQYGDFQTPEYCNQCHKLFGCNPILWNFLRCPSQIIV
jgi:hypothetical protein